MKKTTLKTIAILLNVAVMTTVQAEIWDGTIDVSWYNETDNEFTITTAEQLAGLSEIVNNGNNFVNKTIKLGNDIMLNDTTNWKNWEDNPPANEWTRIGYWDSDAENEDEEDKRFEGIFDGCGYIVSGIYANKPEDYQGLFGYVGWEGDATIKNLGVIASYVSGKANVGLLTGGIEVGKVINCYTAGKVKGSSYEIGGLMGFNAGGDITDSYSTADVEGKYYVGGLLGSSSSNNEVRNCYATGNVQGNSAVGGLIGVGNGIIANCYATGNVIGTDIAVDGLLGDSDDTDYDIAVEIRNCYAIGNVQGNSYVGGLTGGAYGIIENSYAVGNVDGIDYVGGLMGYGEGTIKYSYSAGKVSGTSNVGGLMGYGKGTTLSSYFDSETSGQSNGYYSSIGKTTKQMKQQSTFSDWDFENIWTINSAKNNGYPYLSILNDDPQTSITTKNIKSKKSTLFAFAGIRNGQINLNLKAGFYIAELYNLQGRLVAKTEINAINGINATNLRTDKLSKGIFVLNVKQAGNSVLQNKITVK